MSADLLSAAGSIVGFIVIGAVIVYALCQIVTAAINYFGEY